MLSWRDLGRWLGNFSSRTRNIVGLFILMIMVFNGYGTYDKQYRITLADKKFARERVEKICKNAENVALTNYGEKCRQYEFDSQVDPNREGLEAILDSWYIWDKRTGYTLGTVILVIVIFFMGGILCSMYYFGGRSTIILDRMNDYEDSRFIDNEHTHSRRYGRPHLTSLQHNTDTLKEA